MIPLQFDAALSFKEGMAAVQKNGKWGFIDNKGNMVVDFVYDEVESFTNDFALVTVKTTKYYIDKTGKEAFLYEVP